MVILALPIGKTYGWGNCGRWITREMSRLTDVHLLIPPIGAEQFTNAVEHEFFRELSERLPELRIAPAQWPEHVEHAIIGATGYAAKMLPAWGSKPRGTPNVGYTFFERE